MNLRTSGSPFKRHPLQERISPFIAEAVANKAIKVPSSTILIMIGSSRLVSQC